MGLQLTDSELDEFLSTAHTATLTTLRRDGWPVTLPVWFVWTDGHMFLRTPPGSAKMKRLARDDRCCVLVESGRAWVDLAAVEFAAHAVPLPPGPESDRITTLLDEQYADNAPPWDRLPQPVVDHYASQVCLRLDPLDKPISWNNAKIRLQPSG